ncbi:hydroxyacid-oxoacid transhydrogenase [Rhodoferax sp.]|uniref:hydroxyacid-oxoacid transhydrogenase n=1 Tax=Rhodoferax sp. TaxID=50421 RepID=UPI00272F6B87|nr:hydroxyacid-oxoacid transhydrogenase [Rhodoferax sp.]MDP1530632.1 hydroxyacid-oxoacid transhydrogenase [Rhodoferax sp.]MDP1944695.1 hydroxyacid-oxoacid transhydrogenase [Rhodoferax sp.]MDP2443567.1 hydroxyacid-oxoacid transhydrogenase [Rhodoferax sp.]MDZ4208305.1 hydroxyacid-oxoacid transhydrogenase [Rhodoferax sp.]
MATQSIHQPINGGETIFTVSSSPIKFGAGALRELGEDALALGMKRVAFFVDSHVLSSAPGETALASLRAAGVDVVVYDQLRYEPNSDSFEAAAAFAREGAFDGFVSLGGGSVIDTAKAANLLSTYPDELIAYINAPIGRAKPVPGKLKPHIACPTTCGTGSETTGITIVDLKSVGLKTGIASPFLKPTLALVDPTTTETLPGGVVAACGFDVLTHAVESYTARPFTSRPRPAHPSQRPPYQGSTPYNDIGAIAAIRIGGKYLARAVRDAGDIEARHQLMFASTLAGLAFGSAGVHIPHAMSYSVATLRHEFTASGYQDRDPMVPHGIAVVINAPAAFRFTASANPARHLEATAALGVDVSGAAPENAGEILANAFIALMRETGLPSGIAALGYSDADVPALAEGAFAQQRPLVMAPRAVTKPDLEAMYRDAMRYW